MTPVQAIEKFASGEAKIALSRNRAKSVGGWVTGATIVVADVAALSIVYWLAVLARYLLAPDYHLSFYLQLFPGIVLFLVAFLLQGLYPGILMHPVEEIRRVSYGVTTVFLLIAAATFLSRDANDYSRSVFLMTWTVGVPAVLLSRTIVRKELGRRKWWGVPAVILGSGPAAHRVAARIGKQEFGLRLLGILSSAGNDKPHAEGVNDELPQGEARVIGGIEEAPSYAACGAALYAIVVAPEVSTQEFKVMIQRNCRGFRHILLMPDLPYACSLGVTALDVGGNLGIEVPQRLFHRGASLVKRSLDLIGSLIGIILLFPVFALIAFLVKVTTRGPVFYGHARHGKDGTVFKALKFRTMVINGEQILNEWFRRHPEQQDIWEREHKLKQDPRVTAVGRWLRRLSLDELPQMFNVLMGQMSLVGPRPIVLNEVGQYGESFEFCTSVRPGITGLWQVSGRNELAFEDRVRFNEYYIRNWSVWLDLYILFRTVRVVLGGEGAY